MAFVTRRVVRTPTGPKIQFVNPQTGEVIPFEEIGNYEMIEQGVDLDFLEERQKKKKEEEEKKEETPQPEERRRLFEGSGHSPYHGFDESPSEGRLGAGRNQGNNFGYFNKPDWMGFLNQLPGQLGLAGKVTNIAINTNNLAAINAARNTLGLETLGPINSVRGILSDPKGYIGDMVIGDEQYAVGLEALAPDGRTTLTPAEASRRSTLAKTRGQEVREATREETKAASELSVDEFGKPMDLSSPKGIAKGLIDKALGRNQPTGRNTTTPREVATTETGRTGSPTNPPGSTGTATSGPSTGRTITPGRGLANLAPNGLINNLGPNRPNMPRTDLTRTIQNAVENTFGPDYSVSMISGAPNPGKQYGSNRHNEGRALDFDVIDPNGQRVTDQDQLNEFAKELGRQGITSLGHGKGYMGQGRFHADVLTDSDYSRGQGSTWGGDEGVARSFMSERTPVGVLPFEGVPTPSTNPGSGTGDAVAGGGGAVTSFDQEATNAAQEAIRSILSEDIVNPATDNLGRDISDAVLEQMVTTIAGELGRNTIQGILSGDPRAREIARTEIANIAHTIDNRARSGRHNTRENPHLSVMTGSQYNSLQPGNLGTTIANRGLVGGFIGEALNDFRAGELTGTAPNATHYYNPTLVTPAWAEYARDGLVQAGEHVFGDILQPGTRRSEYQRGLPVAGPEPEERPRQSFTRGLLNEYAGSGHSPGDSDGGGSSPGSSGGSSGMGGSSAGLGGGGYSSGEGSGGSGSGTGSGRGGGGGYSSGVGSGGSAGSSGMGSSSGAFGDSMGAGGSQGTAGVGVQGGTMGSVGGPGQGAGSFGGFSAGSLGGSASGFGTGFGSTGQPSTHGSPGFGGFVEGNLGNYGFGGIGSGILSGTEKSRTGGLEITVTPGPVIERDETVVEERMPMSYVDLDTITRSTPTSTPSSTSRGGTTRGGGGFIAGDPNNGALGGSGYGSPNDGSHYGGGNTYGGGGFNTTPGQDTRGSSANDNTGAAHGGGGFGGGGGGGGDKVLCGYFYSKGRIPKRVYLGDLKYAKERLHPRTQEGYWLWAVPLVNFLDKKTNRPIIDNLIFPLTKGWVNEMAYRVGYTKERSLWGRLVVGVGEPVCYALGYLKEKINGI